jgi:serine/threonine-protein kinase
VSQYPFGPRGSGYALDVMPVVLAQRYRLDAPLGRGGMGEVWRASDQVLGREVAVKVVPADRADDTALARFHTEARAAARLNHPHVVAVYDFEAVANRCYLVMELMTGQSLQRELAARGTLPPARVAGIAAQVAAGLAAAHGQDVVHRDIKPSNLLLAADGTVKIADFGVARFTDEVSIRLTATGQIIGTGLYLAPERARGRPAGPASDVYGLGCVLYELLTGRPPFLADNPVALLWLHADASPHPPGELRPGVPEALSTYLLRMLAKDPADRPTARQAAGWFATTAWCRPERVALAGSAPDAPAAAAPRAEGGRGRALRRPATAATAITGAVAVAAASALALSLPDSDAAPPARPASSAPLTGATAPAFGARAPSSTPDTPSPSATSIPTVPAGRSSAPGTIPPTTVPRYVPGGAPPGKAKAVGKKGRAKHAK